MTTFYDSTTALRWLLPGLQRLDALLGERVSTAAKVLGAEIGTDPYRGLYVSPTDVNRLLARSPGAPPFGPARHDTAATWPDACPPGSSIEWLVGTFDLSRFDLDIVLVALAPELDLRYERVFAYLQDDVTRRRPSVDLALNLFCGSVDEKLAQRARFAPDAPLVRNRIIWTYDDVAASHAVLLSRLIKLDDQISNLLLGLRLRDQRLAPLCVGRRVGDRSAKDLPADTFQRLTLAAQRARSVHRPLVIHLRGPSALGRRRAAETIALHDGRDLLHLDLSRPSDTQRHDLVRVAVREAWLHDEVLYLDGIDASIDGHAWDVFLESITRLPVSAILGGAEDWRPASSQGIGIVSLHVDFPDLPARRAQWTVRLAEIGTSLPEPAIASLAGHFELELDQIADAVTVAGYRASDRIATEALSALGTPTFEELAAAAREQSRPNLQRLAVRVEPAHTWSDLVLPADAVAQLHDICTRVRHQPKVLGDWGFAQRLSRGRGITALFAGPSGTGKTMAAEVIAADLGLDLYKVDLAGVVSKYIGETEKNLERIFTTTEHANAILFFDEADALFGKRSEVRDSHDRYANIETAYLLQRMEQYGGIAILATNLRGNLDEAFTRRIAFTILFPFPEDAERRAIWQGIWPETVPRDSGIDFGTLAARFRLSGGQIRNVAVGAAFLAAADDDDVVRLPHLLRAIRREYEKMGHTLSCEELRGGDASTSAMIQ